MSAAEAGPAESRVRLRPVADRDLPVFFEQQTDPAAIWMAAFVAEDPHDRVAFDAHWAKIRTDPTLLIRTIEFDGEPVGHIECFEMFGERSVGYCVIQPYWGQGIATAALTAFLPEIPERPLYARAVADNAGSIRVLEKCGFVLIREESAYANGRSEVVNEYVFILHA